MRDSREFRDFLQLVRDHVIGSFQTVNDLMQEHGRSLPDVEDLAARARSRLDGP